MEQEREVSFHAASYTSGAVQRSPAGLRVPAATVCQVLPGSNLTLREKERTNAPFCRFDRYLVSRAEVDALVHSAADQPHAIVTGWKTESEKTESV